MGWENSSPSARWEPGLGPHRQHLFLGIFRSQSCLLNMQMHDFASHVFSLNEKCAIS